MPTVPFFVRPALRQAHSTRYGFYYDAIKPYKHYVPFMVNSSDDILEVGVGRSAGRVG